MAQAKIRSASTPRLYAQRPYPYMDEARRLGIRFGPATPSTSVRKELIRKLPRVRMNYGQYLSSLYLPAGYVPVRKWAREHGLERYLSWDPTSGRVYLAGQEVPVGFIYKGRSYAPASRLDKLLAWLRRQHMI